MLYLKTIATAFLVLEHYFLRSEQNTHELELLFALSIKKLSVQVTHVAIMCVYKSSNYGTYGSYNVSKRQLQRNFCSNKNNFLLLHRLSRF